MRRGCPVQWAVVVVDGLVPLGVVVDELVTVGVPRVVEDDVLSGEVVVVEAVPVVVEVEEVVVVDRGRIVVEGERVVVVVTETGTVPTPESPVTVSSGGGRTRMYVVSAARKTPSVTRVVTRTRMRFMRRDPLGFPRSRSRYWPKR